MIIVFNHLGIEAIPISPSLYRFLLTIITLYIILLLIATFAVKLSIFVCVLLFDYFNNFVTII